MAWDWVVNDIVASAFDHLLGGNQLPCCEDTQVANWEAHMERNEAAGQVCESIQSISKMTVAQINSLTAICKETLIPNNPANPPLSFWPSEKCLLF